MVRPITASVLDFRTPRVSRSQPGVQAATHDFSRNKAPKELIDAHGRPAAPLLRRVKDSTVFEPIKAVRAAISTIPDPSVLVVTMSQIDTIPSYIRYDWRSSR